MDFRFIRDSTNDRRQLKTLIDCDQDKLTQLSIDEMDIWIHQWLDQRQLLTLIDRDQDKLNQLNQLNQLNFWIDQQ